MYENEKSTIWMRVLLSVVLLALLVGGGYAVYRLGFTRGAVSAEAGEFPMEHWFDAPMVPHHSYYPRMGYAFFPLGGLLFGLFFLMLVFGLFRRIVFGPPWMRWGYGPHDSYRHPHHPRWGRYPEREENAESPSTGETPQEK
jgi:hypothetical protein